MEEKIKALHILPSSFEDMAKHVADTLEAKLMGKLEALEAEYCAGIIDVTELFAKGLDTLRAPFTDWLNKRY